MKKILVRAPQWLGDAVVSTVFLDRLKHREKESRITVLCARALAPLFERHPAVTSTLSLPYPEGTVFDIAGTLRKNAFDEAYVLPRSFRAALEAFLGRIPRRVGYAGDFRRPLLTEAFPYEEKRRYAHRYLALIKEDQLSLDAVLPFFPAEKPADPKLASLKKPILGVAPVSIAPARTWFPERFAEAAGRWQAKTGGTVVLFGSADERAAVQKVADGIGGHGKPALNLAGELSLPELGWMIKHCDAFLGNDSGLMHVAGAFQIPGAIIFGSSDPANALPPWGRLTSIQHKEIPCVPCLRNHCVLFGDRHNACLQAVTTEEISHVLEGGRT